MKKILRCMMEVFSLFAASPSDASWGDIAIGVFGWIIAILVFIAIVACFEMIRKK